MSFNCISCKAEISRDFKACPHCGEAITDFLREYLDKPIDGKYQILERLGLGGMGEVYKTLHIHLNTIRVIKIMRPSMQDELDAHERFNREARLATKIHHPNVATLHDFSILPDGTKYMVWEYIFGKSLAAVVRDRGALSSRHACSIAIEVLHGLDAIHRAGIIHRDVSPDNIMLSRDDQRRELVKIIDLGIAKTRIPEPDADETRAGTFVGKWRYCSPEQIGMLPEGETIDRRADLYSFGIVMYEMLTGTPPFIADGPHQYMLKHASQTPLPMQIAKPELSVAPLLEAIVFKALEKDRDKRFDSAREFAAELERVLPSLEDTMGLRRRKDDAAAQAKHPQTPRPEIPPEMQKTEVTPPAPDEPKLAGTEPTAVTMRPAAAPAVAPPLVAAEAPKAAERPPSKKPLVIGAIAALVILMVLGVVGGRVLSRKEAKPQPAQSAPVAQMDAARNPAVVPPVQTAPQATTIDAASTATTATIAAVTETEAPPTQTRAAEKRVSPAKAQKDGPQEKTAAAAPAALPPEPPRRSLFGRRDRRFADSPEYARGFIPGIIKNYEELQQGKGVHWSFVAPGVKLASQKIVFGKFTNLSELKDSSMLSTLNDAFSKVEVATPRGTLRAQGAVIWAEADPKKPQGVAVEVVFRNEKGNAVAALRHVERQQTAALAAKRVAEAVSEFVRTN